MYLHKKETLPDTMVNRRFFNLPNLGDKQEFAIRGSNYKYINQASSKATAPTNLIVYHGVEFIEMNSDSNYNLLLNIKKFKNNIITLIV